MTYKIGDQYNEINFNEVCPVTFIEKLFVSQSVIIRISRIPHHFRDPNNGTWTYLSSPHTRLINLRKNYSLVGIIVSIY